MNQIVPLDLGKDINVIKLAREIAIDHYPIADILKRYSLSSEDWDALNQWPRFLELVEAEKQNWNSALNTNARIKLKSSTVIEEWLEEGHRLLHDAKESFNSKVELLKLLGKFSGMEAPANREGDIAGRVTINIKIGEEAVVYAGEPEYIDAEPVVQRNPDALDYDWDEEFTSSPEAAFGGD